MATIVMSAEKVIGAANYIIERIEANQNAADEANIKRVMLGKKIGKWFKFYNPTREQAIEILDEGNIFGWRSQRGWGDLAHAKKLLILAKHGDPVTLNEEDTRVLF